MKTVLFCAIVASFCGYSIGYSLGNRERSTDQLSDLKAKLSKLQSLLKEIREEEAKRAAVSADEEEKLLSNIGNDKVKLPVTADQDKGEEANMKMKKFAESMTPRDIETLSEIKRMLEAGKMKKQAPAVQENPGTFTDKTADIVEDESKQFDWRDLARELEAEREALYLEKMNDELPLDDPKSVKTKEGMFGAFRDEIKESVEKNLLSDIGLAIHSGISLDELLGDLTDTGSSNGESGWWKKN